MSKVRVTWGFQDVVLSSQLNEQITDYLTRGQLVHSSSGWRSDTAGGIMRMDNQVLGWYPFHGARNVYDRMDLIVDSWHFDNGGGGVVAPNFEYNLGAGFVNAALGAYPAGVTAMIAPTSAAGWAQGATGYQTIDISGVVGAQWFGWQWDRDPGAGAMEVDAFAWYVTAYLYSSVSPPF